MYWPEMWGWYALMVAVPAAALGVNLLERRRNPRYRWYWGSLITLVYLGLLAAMLYPVYVNHLWRVGVGRSVVGVAFSPDGRTLASVTRAGALRLYDPATGRATRRLASAPGLPVGLLVVSANEVARLGNSLAFTPDGRTLVAREPGGLAAWDVATARRTHRAPGYVRALSLSPDGRWLATVDNGAMQLSDARTWQSPARRFSTSDGVHDVALSRDRAFVATRSGVRVVRLADGAAVGRLPAVDAWLAISADGRRLATPTPVGGRLVIALWDTATMRRVGSVHAEEAWAVALAADGRLVAAALGGEEPTVAVWEAETGRLRERVPISSAWRAALALSPDGRRLAAGTDDGRVRVINLTP